MSSPLLPPAPQASREDSARSLALRARDLLLAPLIAAGHAALARALAALLDLFEKWQAGTLPPPPAPRPAAQPASRPAPARKHFAPLAWLMGLFTPSASIPSFRQESASRHPAPHLRRPIARSSQPGAESPAPAPQAETPPEQTPATRHRRARRAAASHPRPIAAQRVHRSIRRAVPYARAGPLRARETILPPRRRIPILLR